MKLAVTDLNFSPVVQANEEGKMGMKAKSGEREKWLIQEILALFIGDGDG